MLLGSLDALNRYAELVRMAVRRPEPFRTLSVAVFSLPAGSVAVTVIALLPSAIASWSPRGRPCRPTVVAIAPLVAFWRRISAPAWDLPLTVTTAFLTCALFLGEMTLTLGLDLSSTQVATADRSLSPPGP